MVIGSYTNSSAPIPLRQQILHHHEVLDMAAARRANEHDPRDVYEALQFLQSRNIAELGVKFYRGALVNGSVPQLRDAVHTMRRESGFL